MEIQNGNPFWIAGRPGEQITIRILAAGTEHRVSYSLNQNATNLQPGETIELTIEQQEATLELAFEFSNPVGGSYTILAHGDPNTDVSKFRVSQSLEGPSSLSYRFSSSTAEHRISGKEGYKIRGTVRPDEVTGSVEIIGSVGGDETKGDYE